MLTIYNKYLINFNNKLFDNFDKLKRNLLVFNRF